MTGSFQMPLPSGPMSLQNNQLGHNSVAGVVMLRDFFILNALDPSVPTEH